MADNVEEFLLKYKVDVAETLRKLDQLNEKLDRTGRRGKASVGGMTTDFKSMAKGIVAAGAAITGAFYTIMKSIRAATDAMKDYNEQAIIARKTGIGMQTQEAIAANMSRGSGGRVSRAESRQALNSIGEFVSAAYTDPTRMNMQNVKLRMMGISPTGANGMIAGTGNVMDQLGKRWKDMTEEMARAEGDLLGLSMQTVDAMRQLGGAVSDTSTMTLEQVTRQKEASEAAKKLNEALNGIEKDFGDIVKVITDDVLPILAQFFKLVQEGSHNLAGVLAKEGLVEGGKHVGRALWEDFKARVGAGKDDKVPTFSEQLEATGKKESEADHKKAQDIIDQDTKNAELNHETSKKMELTANQFAQAVSAMPGSISMQQAIAAWAGEAGKGMTTGGAGSVGGTSPNVSSGGPGSGGGAAVSTSGGSGGKATRGIRNNNPGNLEYGPFAKSQGATGTDGRFAIFPTMEMGVKAHEALLGGSKYLGAGLDTPAKIVAKYAPANENNQAAYLNAIKRGAGFDANQKLGAGDMSKLAAAMEVHESGYRGGPGLAAGASKNLGINEIQRFQAGAQIAGQLHMNPEQFMRETAAGKGVSKSDVQYGIDAQRKAMITKVYQIENEIKGYESAGKPQLMHQKEQELFAMKNQMRGFEKYAGGFLGSAQAGGAVRTEGMPPIQIIVNGASDPKAVADEVKRILGQEMHKAVNDADTKHVS